MADWRKVEGRESLPDSTCRVLMFVRGVGPRIGTCTSLFELPWNVLDDQWMDTERKLPLEEVAFYVNLDALPWSWDQPSPSRTDAGSQRQQPQGDPACTLCGQPRSWHSIEPPYDCHDCDGFSYIPQEPDWQHAIAHEPLREWSRHVMDRMANADRTEGNSGARDVQILHTAVEALLEARQPQAEAAQPEDGLEQKVKSLLCYYCRTGERHSTEYRGPELGMVEVCAAIGDAEKVLELIRSLLSAEREKYCKAVCYGCAKEMPLHDGVHQRKAPISGAPEVQYCKATAIRKLGGQ